MQRFQPQRGTVGQHMNSIPNFMGRNRHDDAFLTGGRPMAYASGGQIDVKRPPQWSRDMALRERDPYSLRMFQEDVEDWCALTTEDRSRWGPLIYASIGGVQTK